MRIDGARLRRLGRAKGLTLNALLALAGVSKTAFYHLLHKDSVLPASLRAIAETLGIRPGAFLTEKNPEVEKIRRIQALTDRIVANDRGLDRDNVRLTLILLEQDPLQRLNRSLVRGRNLDFHQ
jgi:transcriptional regulator with XRE-family HTH domain